MESLYLIILLFFIVIFIIPVGFNVKLSYNFLQNHGVISIIIWKIPVFVAKLTIKDKNLIIKVNHKKRISQDIELQQPDYIFLNAFQKEIQNKIKLTDIKMITKVGLLEADKSAILSSIITNAILLSYAKAKQTNPTCTFSHTQIPDYNGCSFFVFISSKFSFSAQDIVYSFLSSMLKTKGEIKNERI